MESLTVRQDLPAIDKPTIAVAVNEFDHSDSDSSSQHAKSQTVVQERTITRTSSFQMTRVTEATRSIRSRIVQNLDDIDEHYFSQVGIRSYVEFIANERLVHMPRKDSLWDQVLKAAEFFGVQLNDLGSRVAYFVPEIEFVSQTALASCLMLLELGHNNAPAINSTFDALSDFGYLISHFLQQQELFDASRDIQEDLGDVFEGLVHLVGEIAIYYRARVNRLSSHQAISVDFQATFGKDVDRIWRKKQHLSNHIWALKLGNKRYAYTIEEIRSKLCPVDQPAEALLFSRLADKAERAQGTCEWIQGHLLNFLRSNDKSLTITGASGCGKSMLASWIKDRLQSTFGRVSYETISHTFANDAQSEASPIAFLKHLLSQLLERNLGDVKLYGALVKVFEVNAAKTNLEASLWDALKFGLQTVQEQKSHLLIVTDGLDEISGHQSAAKLHKRLHECVSQFDRVRTITLSKPISHLGLAGCRNLVITPDHNERDITIYLHDSLAQYQHFNSEGHVARDDFVDSLVKKAKGSFLWAWLVVKLLGKEHSHGSFFKAGQDIQGNTHAVLHKFIGQVDLKNVTTRRMFEFMLAASRPLTVSEMGGLLAIDLQNRTVSLAVDVRKHIATHCFSSVVIRNGLVRFKHSAIRSFILSDLCGKVLASPAAIHTELTQCLLFYVKNSLVASREPSFEVLGWSTLEETFGKYQLLQYTVRNWVAHFRLSTLCGQNGEIKLSSTFKTIFPDSSFFGILEWSCWQRQWSLSETVERHNITLQIRKACFGENHLSVMQTMMILATIHRSTSSHIKAAEYFYHACIIGQAVLHKFSAVVIACTTSFLTCTETIQITKRTEIVTYRETMVRFMIEICKSRHGASSDQVIRWYETLCELYIAIKEEQKAIVLYKELHEIIIVRFGRNHPKARGISETLGGLTVVLRGDSDQDVKEYDEWFFETSEEMEEFDKLRISIVLRMCKNYEHSGAFFMAEKLYIKLWRRISETCRLNITLELQILKIDISLEYCRFLQRIKRIDEAQSILLCLWAEYEHHECEEETLIIRIKELGTLFKAFGLLTAAVSIFSKVWSWFKSKGKTTHEEALSTAILITEVVEEIETTMATKKTTTTTSSTVTETVVREIYETHYERCRHTKVDSYFFKSCMSLISIYTSQEKWSECEVVIKRSLELTWKAILTIDAKITLSGAFVKESILVATQLAICYHRQHYFEKAEEIYLRIYRACLASFNFDHACVAEASLVLIRFYEEYHRHEKVIEIYRELLEGYRKHCGSAHQLTIQTLYALGSICLTLGRKEAYGYYIDIVTVLNKNSKHCHHSAFEAAFILCCHYHEEKRWTELRKICAVLWETFVHHHREFEFTEEMVITLYERYTYVLEFHAKVEFSVLYKISIEYRETVAKRFSASSTILIKALVALAAICEKHEEHYHESITIYEEVIKRTKTTTTTTTTVEETVIKTVKQRLSSMYVTVITTGKSSSTTTVERGIAICLEIFEQLKLEFGCWHERTLTQLRELVIMYHKHGKHESTIIKLLEAVVIETITKVTTSVALYQAAATIASIYLSVGLAKIGHNLLHQLRHLIVLHEMTSSTEITISIGKVSKVAFVFLIAFEQALTSKPVLSFSEVMADILLESYLYEEYTRTIQSSVSIEIKLQVGATLYTFWLERSRSAQADVLAHSLFSIFQSSFKEYFHTSESSTFTFFLALLVFLGRDTRTFDFGHLVCQAAETKVSTLIAAGSFTTAHDVATAAFQLISAKHYFQAKHNIPHGYRLAALLAGIDARTPTDAKLRATMLATSRNIANAMLDACRAANLDFTALKFEDVSGLVRLLGAQENYIELEYLLLQLWRSREVHRSWNAETVLMVGQKLVHAHFKAGHVKEAVELCNVICYNLRRSRSYLERETLDMSALLAQLYTEMGRYSEAMCVHGEVLREIDEETDADKTVDKELASHVLELLMHDHARLGRWEKGERGYAELAHRVAGRYGVNKGTVEAWGKDASDKVGKYQWIAPHEWWIQNAEEMEDEKKKQHNIKKRESLLKAAKRRSYGFGKGGF
ncbi:MAG: hypothetical protein M1820_002675 [Bogoriella megaspora]|nr:MAG: hypothetical protein M1820_002675 [Bogoriella megaspora]